MGLREDGRVSIMPTLGLVCEKGIALLTSIFWTYGDIRTSGTSGVSLVGHTVPTLVRRYYFLISSSTFISSISFVLDLTDAHTPKTSINIFFSLGHILAKLRKKPNA